SYSISLCTSQNVGAGNVNSIGDFKGHSSKLVSRSDIIAMGVIWGVAACGGPPIPFRYGRKDALKAGRSGVPEPQQDLASHIESFRLQGFTQKEMIALVACGHTLGGVRSVDFQDIVPDPSNASIATFDTTSGFDHLIVTQYLNSSTKNPLIRVPSGNSTFASDLRIFGSHRNATMKGLNSETSFSQTCTTLLAKMIDTVPSNVHLSDVVTLLPVKVSSAQITAIDSQLVFMADLRVTFPIDINPMAVSKVRMLWCDSRGQFKNCNRVTNIASIPFLDAADTSPLTDSFNIQFALYRFKVQISASRSVSKFWFEIDGVVHNNGSNDYLIGQDEIIFVPSLGSVDVKFPQPDPANPSQFLPRTSEGNPISAAIHALDFTGGQNIVPPVLDSVFPLTRNASQVVAEGYSYWQSPAIVDKGSILTVDLEATIKGVLYSADNLGTGHLGPDESIFSFPFSIATNITKF
ncbi:hypothetical protein GALMADRAFT_65949, partial [Galerina marginata CBS 339.88]